MANEPTLAIRRANRKDRPQIVAFHTALYVKHRDEVVLREVVPLIAYRDFAKVLREDVDSMLANPEVAVLLAEQGGTAVGYVTGHVERDDRRVLRTKGIVGDWYVDPSARGTGVGKRLLGTLLDVFRTAGCTVVESATWATNSGARKAHEALGFRETQVTYRLALADED